MFILAKYVFLSLIMLMLNRNTPNNIRIVPKIESSFNTRMPAKNISPKTAMSNRSIIPISKYLMYFGVLLLLLASKMPSRTHSNMISNIYSILTSHSPIIGPDFNSGCFLMQPLPKTDILFKSIYEQSINAAALTPIKH